MKDRKIIHSPNADMILPTEKGSHAAPGETVASCNLVKEAALKYGTTIWKGIPARGGIQWRIT